MIPGTATSNRYECYCGLYHTYQVRTYSVVRTKTSCSRHHENFSSRGAWRMQGIRIVRKIRSSYVVPGILSCEQNMLLIVGAQRTKKTTVRTIEKKSRHRWNREPSLVDYTDTLPCKSTATFTAAVDVYASYHSLAHTYRHTV